MTQPSLDESCGSAEHAQIDRDRDRYHALDLLRFIAAFGVMAFHYCAHFPRAGHIPPEYEFLYPLTSYGALGVDLFFIISGFVITMSTEGRTAAGFAFARMRRLYPAFWVSCTLTVLVVLGLDQRPEIEITLWQYAANMTLLAKFLGQTSIDGAYWSLYMEIIFYSIVFAVMLMGKLSRLDLFLAGWLALSAFNLVITIPRGLGLLALEFCPLFVSGFCYALIARRRDKAWHWIMLLAAIAIASIYIHGRMLKSDPNMELNPIVSIVIVLAFQAIIFCVARGYIRMRGGPILLLLGALSYPVYLLHSEIGTVLINRLHAYAPPLAVLACVVSLILVASYLIVRFVEGSVMGYFRRRPPLAGSPG